MNKKNLNSKILDSNKSSKINKLKKNNFVIENDYIMLLGNLNKTYNLDKKKIVEFLNLFIKYKKIKYSVSTYNIGIANALLIALLSCNNIKGIKVHISSSNDIEDLLFYKKFSNYIIFLSEQNIFDVQKKCNSLKISCLAIGRVINGKYLIINDGLINLNIDKENELILTERSI